MMPYEREPHRAKSIRDKIQKICSFAVGQKVWLIVEIRNKPTIKHGRVCRQIVTVGPLNTMHGVVLPQVTVSYRVIVHGLERRDHPVGADQLFADKDQALRRLKSCSAL